MALRQQLAELNKTDRLYVIKKWEDSADDCIVPLRTDNESSPPLSNSLLSPPANSHTANENNNYRESYNCSYITVVIST